MAKTASQIKAENKERNQQIQQVIDSRNAIHQQQMAGVAEKATARTNAVLGKAMSGATDSGTKAQLKSAIQMVAEGLNKAKSPAKEVLPKTAQGMQKRKENQMEAKTPVDSLQIKKDRANKALSDFEEEADFDASSAHDRKRWETERKRLQQEADRANAEIAARENGKIQEQDNADISTMSEEDRQGLEQYAVNQVRDQNLPLEMQGMMPTAQQEAAGLIGKYGKQRADELAETFMRQENAELAQQADAAGRKFANERPVLASAATVPINLMAAITGTVGQLQGAARSTGRYSSLDANETGTALDKYSGAIREQVAQNIEGEDPNLLRKAGSVLYQGGMSFLDSTARMLATGGSAGISSAIAGMGAFSQGLQKYSAMGASPERAAMAATASAGLEYITEKLPTEQVLKIFHKGGSTSAVKEVLKQAFAVEPLGEEVNLFAGIAAEAMILGDKSSKSQRIGDLISGGMTKEEAEKQFWKEAFQEALNTYAVSAVAGGLGAGGAAYAGGQVQTAQDQRQENAVPSMTEAEMVQNTLEMVGTSLQENAPAPVPETPMTETQKQMQEAMAALPGIEGRQELPQSETGRTEPRQEESAAASDYYDEFEDFGTGGANREEFLGRNWDAVGKRNVKAYMYENPEVKPYFQAEAQNMLMELADSTRAERYYNEDVHYESGGEMGWGGVKRDTSDDIAYLLDTAGFSYEEIQKGLEAIIQDNGAENNAASKRIEFILHNRLMNGHNDFYSNERVPASEDYVNLINEKHITAYDRDPAAQPSAVDTTVGNVNTSANSPHTEDGKTMPAEGGQPQTVSEKGGQQVMQGFAGRDFRASNTYMNTGLHSENANIRAGYRQELRKDPGAALYGVKHNADTLAEAQSRTGTAEKNGAALDELLNKEHWTPEDVATSTLLLDQIMASGDRAAMQQMNALRQKRKEQGSRAGQEVQSFAVHNPTMAKAESPATAVDSFRERLNGMKQEETTWSKATGMDFATWKEQNCQEVDKIGIAIASVEEGDSASMRQIIKQIAQRRGTTAWFGTSENLTNRAWGILKNLEFEDLKKIANTQLVAMADDFRARSKGEVIGGLRKQSMLSSLKTFTRNIAGNTVGGFADAVSESGAGRMMDAVLSHYTGKRTVGNDLARASTYAKAAKEAGQFASLCVELNIPIETDVESSYAAAAREGGNSKYLGKTFRATGNPAMRALYAYQKYMSYALEVSDKIFEGGSNAAVAESLNRLQGANLTEEEVGALADFTGNRRTFKNATWEEDGKTKGSELARFATWATNPSTDSVVGKVWDTATDIAMPFVSTPMNVTQTGIDYTAGVAKGLGEMISIIKDAKAGKTIPVERQRQAASDFGRGVTGTAMIAMFASAAAMGALKASNSEDWDKEALAQAEGRSGAQINWSALQRGLDGGDARWQSGDVISGMDFLEPFNTQMYLGVELAQAEDINLLTYAGSTIKSVWQSLMDSPVMTGLADIEQTIKDISEAETFGDKFNEAVGYAGDVASSYVPQFVRQTAQNQDGYYRDTRGATAAESALNSFRAAIPGLAEDLPLKYSGLGEVQQRGSGVETFLDPTGTKVYEENEVTTFLDELSGRTRDNGIYPSRQAPMRITVADRVVELDGAMRETYQKTYGEAVNDQYRSLMGNPDFQGFSDELKIEALKAAEANARKKAMASVSDYREAPAGSAAQLTKEIVNQQVRKQIGGLFTDLDTQREYGYSTQETAAQMEQSYLAFERLTPKTRKEILNEAVGDTARYLEVRQKGISTEDFVNAAANVDSVKGSGKNGGIRDIDKRQAIANTKGMTDKEIDIVMKAYMGDYDPNDPDSEKTELKYDYIRQELGLSPAAYAATYRAHLDNSKKAEKIDAIMALGYDKKIATTLYNIYAGNAKGKALYMP